ncbi:tRNA (adenine(22)-N(1))-methyltransferase [Salinicoccus albus]|uniref:tRNA (adenine(22)-N(1))-methyltransferase n=1 Tax=Salinicoccus albus TaxID=418756 RepID=UPI000364F664|nr:tRNA (adenine(22)-N(1))-methyltransferase TrmK [Salinicoccus albus]
MLDNRLETVSTYIKGTVLADIGSDHAYLPIFAIKNKMTNRAICGEVVKGPYESTKENIRRNELTDLIEARLGAGLEILTQNDNIDTITICGMGGPLIAEILTSGFDHVKGKPRLVLQPNTYSFPLRNALVGLGYKIMDETVVQEGAHFYEIIVAEPGYENYTEKDLKFGPILLHKRENAFMEKLKREVAHQRRILYNLETHSKNDSKVEETKRKIQLIEEVL